MSIKLSNTGGRRRLAKSKVSVSDEMMVIEHYIDKSGYLAPVYFNYRNSKPALMHNQVAKNAFIGAFIDDVRYRVSVRVYFDKVNGLTIASDVELIIPNSDFRIGSVDTLPLSTFVETKENLTRSINEQIFGVISGWSEEANIWLCLNDWLESKGLL